MRCLLFIIGLAWSFVASAQSIIPPRCPSRETDEVKARMKEIGRRLSIIESEIASLRYDTINIQPAMRVQQIDSLMIIRTEGKETLLELDRRLQELQDDK